MDVHIRWMIRRDMPQVLSIEMACFGSPWNEEDFIKCLRQRNCIGMVAEADEEVIGFMIYELHKKRLDLLDFAVHPLHHRKGVGTAMIEKLRGKLSFERRRRLVMPVCESNLNAQLFCKAMGLKAVDVHREYFGDGQDAYIFELTHVPSVHELAEA